MQKINNFSKIIKKMPEQFRDGFNLAKNIKMPEKKYDQIIICGMGGSALAGEILKMASGYFGIKIPVLINKSYKLPDYINKNPLLIAVSYSGNTEETISCLNEGIKNKLNVIAISCGGKLEKQAKQKNIVFLKLKNGTLQPRHALFYIFSTITTLLIKNGLAKNKIKELLDLENITPANFKKKGEKLAEKILNKIPIIYSSENFLPLSYNLKIKFNENVKIHAFVNFFPELNHNEIAGFSKLPKLEGRALPYFAFIIKDASYDKAINKRINLTADLIKKMGYSVEIIENNTKDFLKKCFELLILFDWITCYLALKYGVNPLPVEIIEEFKKKL